MNDLFDNATTINGTVFFASDFHLGSPDKEESEKREQLIIRWLEQIKSEATHLFLLGDIFDFWFEYHDVVPKGYFLFLAKLSELRTANIEIMIFTGNHDMWMKNYLIDELGVKIYRKETPFIINGKRCLVGHGDGLGNGDRGYKLIKALFAFRPNQWMFGWLHPRIAFGLARFFSRKSRAVTGKNDEVFMGNDKELIAQYALKMLQIHQIDYFIYGHRHLPLNIALSATTIYLNSGDWLAHNSYLRADEQTQKIALFFFNDPSPTNLFNINKKLIQWFLAVISICFSLNLYAQTEFPSHSTSPLFSWQFEYNGQWYPATVPGSIYTDLFTNRLIPDPFLETNEDSVRWVSIREWKYKTGLADAERLLNTYPLKHFSLVFEGVNGSARFFWNNQPLTSEETPFYNQAANNSYRRYSFDLKDFPVTEHDSLLVVFAPALEEAMQLAAKLPYTLPELRAHSRIPPYQAGWDWGPNLPGVGIWKNVFFEGWGGFKIDDIQAFATVHHDEDEMNATIEVITTIISDEDRTFDDFEYFFSNKTDCFHLDKGHNKVTIQKGINYIKDTLQIKNAHLWFPNEMGEQFLYTMEEIIVDNNKVDRIEKKIGIREILLNRENDSIGEAFTFVVNGNPVFAKGANWIPADFFSHRVTKERYRDLLQSCKDAHFNMLRVWGGGYYEDDYFYELCDEMGIMVWQDFMFACALYPADTAFLQNVTTETTEQILRLRNHPCLALWCGNNEVKNGWEDWGWQSQYEASTRAQIGNDQKQIFDTLLPNLVAKFDKNRAYHASSPLWGWGHKEALTEGDSHYWGVWWGEEPFEIWNSKTGRFMSEFGFQSYPQMSTIATFTSENERNLDSPAMKNHQKHGRGVQIIDKAIAQYFGFNCNKPYKLEEYVALSQKVQAIGVGMALETFRLKAPYCMGALYWQLNDCWPVASWSSIDYFGNRKALHYEVARQFAPTIIACDSAFHDGTNIYMVSDTAIENGTIVVLLIDAKEKIVEKTTFNNLQIAANHSKLITHYALKPRYQGEKNSLMLRLLYQNRKGDILAEKVHFFVYPKEMSAARLNFFLSRYNNDKKQH